MWKTFFNELSEKFTSKKQLNSASPFNSSIFPPLKKQNKTKQKRSKVDKKENGDLACLEQILGNTFFAKNQHLQENVGSPEFLEAPKFYEKLEGGGAPMKVPSLFLGKESGSSGPRECPTELENCQKGLPRTTKVFHDFSIKNEYELLLT